jgi:hypothetical protein
MNSQERKTALNEMKNDALEHIAKYQKRLDAYSNVLLGNGFIVFQHNMGMLYEFEGLKAINAQVCDILNANLFTREDAEHLAANTFDGANVAKSAIHIKDALQICIDEQVKQVEWYDELLAGIKE